MDHTTDDPNNEDLYADFKSGCPSAFTKIFGEGEPLRLKMEAAARRTCSDSLVDDAVSETLLKFWLMEDKATRLHATTEAAFTGLVCVATANMGRDVNRKQNRHVGRVRRAEESANIADFSSDPIDDHESLRQLQDLLDLVGVIDNESEHDRDIVELRMAGYGYAEISNVFGEPAPWANNRMRTIRKRLQRGVG